jgi:hypothetical protein
MRHAAQLADNPHLVAFAERVSERHLRKSSPPPTANDRQAAARLDEDETSAMPLPRGKRT